MLYELRLYDVAVGRMPDMLSRMQIHLMPLFVRHRIPWVGCWDALSGPRLPRFVYLVAWQDDAARQAGWGGFYQDPDWLSAREATNAGSELVERAETIVLAPGKSWDQTAAGLSAGEAAPELHELLIHNVAPGASVRAHDNLTEFVLPSIVSAGGSVLGTFDVVFWSSMPSIAVLTSWPDLASRLRAHATLQAHDSWRDRQAQERRDRGRTTLGPATALMLQPLAFGRPNTDLAPLQAP